VYVFLLVSDILFVSSNNTWHLSSWCSGNTLDLYSEGVCIESCLLYHLL
jgi:hypothetical protein